MATMTPAASDVDPSICNHMKAGKEDKHCADTLSVMTAMECITTLDRESAAARRDVGNASKDHMTAASHANPRQEAEIAPKIDCK
mmetsp:Transcript_68083/g.94662  ORF Transcript_68083/g.94662 Transcript_68083/m.94662 type:complete len:85 (-) Transcript_68083:382-636(-)